MVRRRGTECVVHGRHHQSCCAASAIALAAAANAIAAMTVAAIATAVCPAVQVGPEKPTISRSLLSGEGLPDKAHNKHSKQILKTNKRKPGNCESKYIWTHVGENNDQNILDGSRDMERTSRLEHGVI